jgi:fido (protein-threonine AMPylation protein)
MNDTSKKLAISLEQLKALQDKGVVAIQSKVLSRTHRERLLKHSFIKEVIKGWYIPTIPDDTPGDSTSWYTSYWEFCAAYLTERFNDDWCLSAEQSINLHIGDNAVPQQLLVRSPKGRNKPTKFLHDTSIFDVKLAMPTSSEIIKMNGLNVYSLASAIVNCSKRHFTAQPTQIRTALSMITDASEVLVILLKGGQSVVAGRIAGAFRNIGRDLIANNILKGMAAADYKIQEINPFDDEPAITFGRRDVSPYVNRMRLMWATMREVVIAHFPSTASKALTIDAYMDEVGDKYVKDAYHSLSIEGYRVTPELIELVRSGDWNPEKIEGNRHHLDALAAKGYWDAFQEVKKAVLRILEGENAGEVLEEVHGDWYFSLFGSSVAAGIIKQSDLAGYRNGPVYIRRSMHTPPSREALRDMMPTLFDLLIEEENPAVRVVLGHFFFVYIHPYFDGNGRMGRFLMNVMMASGGHSWTVVPVERRREYMQSLEAASVNKNILPFTQFLSSLVY